MSEERIFCVGIKSPIGTVTVWVHVEGPPITTVELRKRALDKAIRVLSGPSQMEYDVVEIK